MDLKTQTRSDFEKRCWSVLGGERSLLSVLEKKNRPDLSIGGKSDCVLSLWLKKKKREMWRYLTPVEVFCHSFV